VSLDTTICPCRAKKSRCIASRERTPGQPPPERKRRATRSAKTRTVRINLVVSYSYSFSSRRRGTVRSPGAQPWNASRSTAVSNYRLRRAKSSSRSASHDTATAHIAATVVKFAIPASVKLKVNRSPPVRVYKNDISRFVDMARFPSHHFRHAGDSSYRSVHGASPRATLAEPKRRG